MKLNIDRRGGSAVAVVEAEPGELVISTVQDALDLLATARYEGSANLAIPKEAVAESFFELRTGLAGEVLQKFTNYGVRVALVGDFRVYESKALRDFIYESNQGGRVFFLPAMSDALNALHCQGQ